VDAPLAFQLEPSLVPLGQLPDALLDQEPASQELGRWVRQLGEHRLVDLGLTTLGELLGFPAVQLGQAVSDLQSAGGVELLQGDLAVRNPGLDALGTVRALGHGDPGVDVPGPEGAFEFRVELLPLGHQGGVQSSGCLGIEGEPVALLQTDDEGEPVLQLDGAFSHFLGLDLLPQRIGDLNVLLAVRLHLRRPDLPVRGLTELTLVDPEAVAPGFQGVGASQLPWQFPLADQASVPVTDLRPDQAGQYQGVTQPFERDVEPGVDLLQRGHVELDDVVADRKVSLHQPSQPLFDGRVARLVSEGATLPGGCVLDHEGMDAVELV